MKGSPKVYTDENGNYHREDGPAIVGASGLEEWYLHGRRHRVGGPAHISPVIKCWFVEDRRHRVDGPAIERNNGENEWFINDLRHREDGPAVDFPDTRQWYLKGRRHRIDGPCIEVLLEDGTWSGSCYAFRGVMYDTKQEFEQVIMLWKEAQVQGL